VLFTQQNRRFSAVFGSWHNPCLIIGSTAEWSAGTARPRETSMFKSERFAQVATAMVGALVISTLSIGAAVGPARAAGPGGSWIAAVPLVAPTGDRAGA
jgi:hypothetical protein